MMIVINYLQMWLLLLGWQRISNERENQRIWKTNKWVIKSKWTLKIRTDRVIWE